MHVPRSIYRNRVTRKALSRVIKVQPRADLVRMGTDYGGWWVPESTLRPDAICYSGGVGDDISFDTELIERYSVDVWAFDPTPSVIDWIGTANHLPSGFRFFPYGLWSEDVELRFYAPRNPRHVSFSATNAQHTKRHVLVPGRSVASLMKELGHGHVDVLKLDIEGAEGPVIESLLSAGVRPGVLCVEFDQPEPLWRTVRRIRDIEAAGYSVLWVEDWNVTFATLKGSP
jgi:FkbM family methyltransferase